MMYAQGADFASRGINRRDHRINFVDRPKAWTDSPAPMETIRPRAMPVQRWTGNWRPSRAMSVRTMGGLGEDIPVAPASVAAAAPMSTWFTPVQATADTGSSWLSDLFSGLGKVITPAVQTLAQVKATGIVQQQAQRTMAQTYNPALTAPAIQAQAWQTAYQGGTGVMPSAAISGTTIAVLAAAAVGAFLLLRK